jgi:hypothetical protein
VTRALRRLLWIYAGCLAAACSLNPQPDLPGTNGAEAPGVGGTKAAGGAATFGGSTSLGGNTSSAAGASSGMMPGNDAAGESAAGGEPGQAEGGAGAGGAGAGGDGGDTAVSLGGHR